MGCRGVLGRPLRSALLLSLLVHFLLLSTAPSGRVVEGKSGVPGKKLQAVRVSMATNPARLPAPTLKKQMSERLTLDRAGPAVVSPVTSEPSAAPAPVAGKDPVEAVVAGVLGGEASPVAQIPSPSAVSESTDDSNTDAFRDALRNYRMALAVHAKRFRRYPPMALERGIGGRADIEVTFPEASFPILRVQLSSGHGELDQAALEMLRRSVESVDFPPLLRGHHLNLILPVEFVPVP